MTSQVSYNGYINQKRSSEVGRYLAEFSGTRHAWEGRKVTGCQNEQTMRYFGITFTILALLVVGGTVGGALAFKASPIYRFDYFLAITIGGSVTASGFLVTGTILICKDYWHDPAFLQKRREQYLHTLITGGYNAAESAYWTYARTRYDIISVPEIRRVLEQTYKFDTKSYLEVFRDTQNTINKLLNDQIFSPHYFHERLRNEMNDNSRYGTFLYFYKEFGWQPFRAGIITQADISDLLRQSIITQIGDTSFPDVMKTYGWSLVDFEVIKKNDRTLQKSLLNYLEKGKITTYFSEWASNVESRKMISPRLRSLLETYKKMYEDAKRELAEKQSAAKTQYDQQVSDARSRRDTLTPMLLNLGGMAAGIAATQSKKPEEATVLAAASLGAAYGAHKIDQAEERTYQSRVNAADWDKKMADLESMNEFQRECSKIDDLWNKKAQEAHIQPLFSAANVSDEA